METTEITVQEARAIAKAAYIYGFPLVDNYRIQYAYFVDRNDPDYKTSWNHIKNIPRVYTAADKAAQSPNTDTPYSWVGADLRAQPLLLTLPPIEKNRYYCVQFVDMYTFDFAYAGSRTTGNGGGTFLLAGPGWNGKIPDSVTAVMRCETRFASIVYRTQLFNAGDIENVKNIQSGFKVQTLSEFLGQPAPAEAAITFLRPLSVDGERKSLEFFNILNFVLQFCPTNESEVSLMARFAKLGIRPGRKFDVQALSPEMRAAIEQGMADAWNAFSEFKAQKIDTLQVTSGDIVGTRDFLKNNYLYRMTAAVLGIYANVKQEAMYPVYFVDSTGKKPDGSTGNYILRFGPGQLPPVNAFWSLTMYASPSYLLVENPLNRYVINSPMLPNLQRDPDGGITLYLQHNSPGKDKESNWLPAPSGQFFTALRLYWPKKEAVDGSWTAPPLELRA